MYFKKAQTTKSQDSCQSPTSVPPPLPPPERSACVPKSTHCTLLESTPQARPPSGRGLRVTTPAPGPGLGSVAPRTEAAVVAVAASPRKRPPRRYAEVTPRRDANLPSPNAEAAPGPWPTEAAPRGQAAPRFATPRKHRAASASPRCVRHGDGGRVQPFAARRLGCLSWRPLNATGPLSVCRATGRASPSALRAFFWLAGIGVRAHRSSEPNGNAKPNDDRQLGLPVALASRTRRCGPERASTQTGLN